MKKPYEKPMFAVEYYQLTQAIAACVTKIGFQDRGCVLRDDDSTPAMKNLAWEGYFVEAICREAATGMDEHDKICYHTNANAAFSS